MQPVRGSLGRAWEGRRPATATATATATARCCRQPAAAAVLPQCPWRRYPLVAVVVVASSLGVYSSIRHLWTNPEVL